MKKRYFLLLALFCSVLLQAEGPRVIGVGTACIDVLISVDEDFLLEHLPGQKGGCSPLDQDILLQMQKMSFFPPKLVPGGCSANQ